MKVFISWSGADSQKVAELFKWWLKCVIQASTPWVSSEDIESGSQWFSEINDQLANTGIGIVCLTKANKDKPWILFETGALTKGLSSTRVCPFLIDLATNELQPPLSQLNVTTGNKESLRKLVTDINKWMGESRLDPNILTSTFETYWPQFDKKFQEIKADIPEGPVTPARGTDDILNEVLSTVRSFDKRIRNIESKEKTSKDNSRSYIDLNYKEFVPPFSDPSSREILGIALKIENLIKDFAISKVDKNVAIQKAFDLYPDRKDYIMDLANVFYPGM